jgi:hypothetical protein
MWRVFSWEVVFELLDDRSKAEGGRTPRGDGLAAGEIGKRAGAARSRRYVSTPPESIGGRQEQR